MHPFSILTLAIFVAGYITARWDLVTRLYELAIFAWDHGVVVSKTLMSQTFRPLMLIINLPIVAHA
jgi:phosphatidylinositol glycan class Q protein